MRASAWRRAVLVVCLIAIGRGIAAADDGWMRPGVRVWYLGAVDGGGITSSNAEEAYLFDAVVGTDATIVHHAALTHWTVPQAVQTATYPMLDMGPCWIHPARLQTLQLQEHWMGHEITFIQHQTYTYDTFPYKLLPIAALFALSPSREVVKLTYMLPGFSAGNAYFDAETGILLYHHALWGTSKMFFILSEINFDFNAGVAFPEDDGPHTGFKSFAVEASLGNLMVGGGAVTIHAMVEARYGRTIEMRVLSTVTGPYGMKQADENFCFFGDVPVVKAIAATQAPDYPPDQWTTFGDHLWWWLPPSAELQNINVIGVPMARAADQSLTFTATTTPAAFHFSKIWFDEHGYMTEFAAKDASIGLDVKPGDFAYENHNTVDGLAYYRSTMAKPFPARPRADFTGDLTSDLLWRGTAGDLWLWGMENAAHATDGYVGTVGDANWEIKGQGDLNGDGMADLLWRHKTTGTIYYWQMNGATPAAELYVATVDVSYDIVGTGDFDGDGKADLLWRNPVIGDLWLWRMNGASVLGQAYVDTVDLSYAIKGLGDLNGDAKTDVVWQGAAGDLWAWLMNGAARTFQGYVGTVADPNYQIQQVADFDGDMKADLLWWNAVAGDVWVWRMNGAAKTSEHYVGLVADTNYRIQAAGDYNGDGKADLLWRNIAGGDLWVWLMNGPAKASEHYVGLVADQGYQLVR